MRVRFIPARAGNTTPCSFTRRPKTVHPRSRGEHLGTIVSAGTEYGSSPLARGTQADPLQHPLRSRFIPARAGNTLEPIFTIHQCSVHPRSRGEHLVDQPRIRFHHGSSPLARGTRQGHPPRRVADRFIPARAGNTPLRTAGARHGPVHPRSRGEHDEAHDVLEVDVGSSPLARGTPGSPGLRGYRPRFIPARAGNTAARVSACRIRPVHPRSRGEHSLTIVSRTIRPGSSPLARGTRGPLNEFPGEVTVHPRSRGEHFRSQGAVRLRTGSSPLARGTPMSDHSSGIGRRFIPARAGNTRAGRRAPRHGAVHPRSRGEHIRKHWGGSTWYGSSPLARGTLPRRLGRDRGRRFIPARAGNTSARDGTRSSPPVHPRSRGEHMSTPAGRTGMPGSSPLARGTRCGRRREWIGDRFIPARAGNTARGLPLDCHSTVHPRSRGEHGPRAPPVRRESGSSPLARGTLSRGR